jgi:hypothetical protein
MWALGGRDFLAMSSKAEEEKGLSGASNPQGRATSRDPQYRKEPVSERSRPIKNQSPHRLRNNLETSLFVQDPCGLPLSPARGGNEFSAEKHEGRVTAALADAGMSAHGHG